MKKHKIYIDKIMDKSMTELEKREFFDAILYDINRDELNSLSMEEIEDVMNIDEIVTEFFDGKSKEDFYFYDKKIMPKTSELTNYIDDHNSWYERIQKQINQIVKSEGNEFNGRSIPRKYVNNILLELKYYYHPFKKKLRNKKFKNISINEIQNYIDNIRNEKELQVDDYTLEKVYKLELYKVINEIKNEIDDVLVYNLLMLQNIYDPVRRLDYANSYKDMFAEINQKWINRMININKMQSEVYEKVKSDIRKQQYKLIENDKEYEYSINDKEYEYSIYDENLLRNINKKFEYESYSKDVDIIKEMKNSFNIIMKNEDIIYKENQAKLKERVKKINTILDDDSYLNIKDDDNDLIEILNNN